MAEPMSIPLRRRRRWPYFFLLALAAISLFLHAANYRRGMEIAGRSRQYSGLVRAKPIAETKARRVRFYQSRYFLGYPMAASYAIASLVRHVDAIAAPLRLLGVQVDPGLQDMRFELTVRVGGSRPREARRRLAAFIERLHSVPGVMSAGVAEAGPDSRGEGERVFTVAGRAELQP
jgi:hypothetical protein